MEAKTEEEGAAESIATGRPEATGRPTHLQRPDERTTPDVRHLELQPAQDTCRRKLQRSDVRSYGDREEFTEVRSLTDVRTVPSFRTPTPTGRPTPVYAAAGLWPCIPLPLTPSWLRL